MEWVWIREEQNAGHGQGKAGWFDCFRRLRAALIINYAEKNLSGEFRISPRVIFNVSTSVACTFICEPQEKISPVWPNKGFHALVQ